MEETKQSTKREDLNTVEPKRDYYLAEYGFSVQARSAAEAEEIAKKRNKQEQAS